MVETIAPVVYGDDRRRYAAALGLHVLGASVTAAALGALLAAAGGLAGAPWGSTGALVLAAIAALYALREAGGLPIPIPGRRGQVPQWWRGFFSPPVASLLYGIGLGAGFFTFLTFGTFVAVATAAFVSGNPVVGVACCTPFGVARGISVAVASRTTTADEAGAVVDRLEKLVRRGVPRAVNAAALTAVALTSLSTIGR